MQDSPHSLKIKQEPFQLSPPSPLPPLHQGMCVPFIIIFVTLWTPSRDTRFYLLGNFSQLKVIKRKFVHRLNLNIFLNKSYLVLIEWKKSKGSTFLNESSNKRRFRKKKKRVVAKGCVLIIQNCSLGSVVAREGPAAPRENDATRRRLSREGKGEGMIYCERSVAYTRRKEKERKSPMFPRGI